nr:hypothetical protein [Jiangella gansuensis]
MAPFAISIAGLLPSSITEHADQVDRERSETDISPVSIIAAGLAHVVEAAERRGLDTSVQRAAHAQMQRSIDAGHGDLDASIVTAALLADAAPAAT